MLLTQGQISSLKKNLNVSKDAEKTKERIKADFRAATKAEKKAAIELSGQVANSIYRIYETGSINARIVLALSQTLNITPLYYTGETDEKNPFDDAQLLSFLESHGYKALIKELSEPQTPAKRKYNRKPKNETIEKSPDEMTDKPDLSVSDRMEADAFETINTTDDESTNNPAVSEHETPPAYEQQADNAYFVPESVMAVSLSFSDCPQMKKAVDELTEQEAIELLHTLFIRAKAGGEAAFTADVVKRCLLK